MNESLIIFHYARINVMIYNHWGLSNETMNTLTIKPAALRQLIKSR